MSKNVSQSTGAQAKPDKPEKVYVTIPKAGPGQKYKAPKNYDQPLFNALGQVVVVFACLSLPIVPAAIIGMIVWSTYATESSLLWLWALMTLLVEGFAIFIAIGLAREAMGRTGRADYQGSVRGLSRQ